MPLKKGNKNPSKNEYAHRGIKASRNGSKTSKKTNKGRIKFVETSVEAKKRVMRKPTPYPVRRSRAPKLKPRPSPKEASNQMRSPITMEALLKISSSLQPNMSNELNSLLQGIVLGINLSKGQGGSSPKTPAGELQATFNQSKPSDAGSPDNRTEVQTGPDDKAIQSLSFAEVQPENVAQSVDRWHFDSPSIQSLQGKGIVDSMPQSPPIAFSASPEICTEVQTGPDGKAIQSLSFAKVQPENVAQGVDHGFFDSPSIQSLERKWIVASMPQSPPIAISASPERRTEVQSENLSQEQDLDPVISATSFISSRHSSDGVVSFVGWLDQKNNPNSRG
ncbi:hypothetical protein KR054_004321 [Drosophila jambulina]|nr:hypothetical protein KR054_004321 [Drosophila jambulina]